MKKTIQTLIAMLAFALAGPLMASSPAELTAIVSGWDRIKYQTPAKEREAAYEALAQRARQLSETSNSPAALMWEAIIKASLAGEKGAMGGALGYVKEAKALLEKAEAMTPVEGGVYTTLGSLYYQVPGWPVGFGDKTKARAYLEKGLKSNPAGIDANYFHGDFLLAQGDYPGALKAFEKALAAAPRPGRELADAGRRKEIEEGMAKARAKMAANP